MSDDDPPHDSLHEAFHYCCLWNDIGDPSAAVIIKREVMYGLFVVVDFFQVTRDDPNKIASDTKLCYRFQF